MFDDPWIDSKRYMYSCVLWLPVVNAWSLGSWRVASISLSSDGNKAWSEIDVIVPDASARNP
jgi:hypothetical protein